VTKNHKWLDAKNYWFVPVVADTSGAFYPASLRLLHDFASLKTDAAEQQCRGFSDWFWVQEARNIASRKSDTLIRSASAQIQSCTFSVPAETG